VVKSRELKVAIVTAKKVGSFLQKSHGLRQPYTFKKISPKLSIDSRKGFLTKKDIEADRIIKSILLKEFPAYGFLSEESRPLGLEKEYVWVVDPLEGTIAYIHGLENYGTAIALLRQKKIILGVVYCPTISWIIWAEEGGGTYLNNKRTHASTIDKIEDAVISIEHKVFRFQEDFPRVTKDLVKRIRRLRVGESCAQEISYVAAGKTDALIKLRQPLYDYAAGKIILEEAGGKLTDFQGKPLKISLDSQEGVDFLASNSKIHQKLLEYF
jgi:myo-inositol-1(or 4)-monophosphatase